ncbi:larval serum protein 1 alpha chain-like [Contarinia nasturtii]|uniref:larval serum protein 1 alpha chain-like n=1 Tax=Contarinia nasturtii TaxID=265458 RepID=UPI0012D3BC59|nr:larval serum protein 1 alpha chain-like [Contarinia nasturtii]
MRLLVLLVILAGAFVQINAKLPVKPAKFDPKSIELKNFLYKQEVILDVFQHVHQNDTQNKLYADSLKLNFTTLGEWYEDAAIVNKFVKRQEIGLLPRGEEFSVLKKSHIEEAIALFRLLHEAENWNTFYDVLVWARFHVNEGVFIYASTVAILHHPDLEGIVLPAPYEIYPYYFFNAETIQEAQTSKMQGFPKSKKVVGQTAELIIQSNYTGWNKRSNPEQKLSYFTEDIGLNAWYFYFHADYPFWIDSKDSIFKNRRGEVYLHTHSQLLARYYLERLSNDMGKIPQFSWRVPFRTGYNPALAYYKGSSFPVRNNFYSTYNEDTYYSIEKLEGLENRVKFAIDHRLYTLPNGTVIDISKPENVELFADLYKYTPYKNDGKFFGLLEVLGRTLLGTAIDNYSTDDYLPSVLEHFETSLRDPAFYQLYGRLIRYYLQWKTKLEPYKEEDIGFEGVQIESVNLDRLVTYFDTFDSDITNAVDIEPMTTPTKGKKPNKYGDDLVIKARQWRLNHSPFTLTLNVTSQKAQKASVKVFLGPKFDEAGNEIDINENRENFYEIDKYVVGLTAGRTILTRNSIHFKFYSNDRTTYFDLYKTVMMAKSGDGSLPPNFSRTTCGFPQRLMLPKGTRTGFAVQLFVIITEYRSPSTWVIQKDWFSSSNCRRDIDARPLGFPLDREIDETIWYTPNMKYIETAIYHKSEVEKTMEQTMDTTKN